MTASGVVAAVAARCGATDSGTSTRIDRTPGRPAGIALTSAARATTTGPIEPCSPPGGGSGARAESAIATRSTRLPASSASATAGSASGTGTTRIAPPSLPAVGGEPETDAPDAVGDPGVSDPSGVPACAAARVPAPSDVVASALWELSLSTWPTNGAATTSAVAATIRAVRRRRHRPEVIERGLLEPTLLGPRLVKRGLMGPGVLEVAIVRRMWVPRRSARSAFRRCRHDGIGGRPRRAAATAKGEQACGGSRTCGEQADAGLGAG